MKKVLSAIIYKIIKKPKTSIRLIPNTIIAKILRPVVRVFYKNKLRRVSAIEKEIVDCLYEEGVKSVHGSTLEIDEFEGVMSECQKLLDGLKEDHLVTENGSSTVKNSFLMNHQKIILFGLSEKLLRIVQNYFRVPFVYRGVGFRIERDSGAVATRLWHKDREDETTVKIILYFNDVNELSGSFSYIPKQYTRVIDRSTTSYRVSDEEIEKIVPQSEIKIPIGRSGQMVFADTCQVFHKGLDPIVKPYRIALFFTYITKIPNDLRVNSSYFPVSSLDINFEDLTDLQKSSLSHRWSDGNDWMRG